MYLYQINIIPDLSIHWYQYEFFQINMVKLWTKTATSIVTRTRQKAVPVPDIHMFGIIINTKYAITCYWWCTYDRSRGIPSPIKTLTAIFRDHFQENIKATGLQDEHHCQLPKFLMHPWRNIQSSLPHGPQFLYYIICSTIQPHHFLLF